MEMIFFFFNFVSREKEKTTYHLKQPIKSLEIFSLAFPENEKEKKKEGKKIKEKKRERKISPRFYFSLYLFAFLKVFLDFRDVADVRESRRERESPRKFETERREREGDGRLQMSKIGFEGFDRL
jgi:flagellar biosynthesis/type III secretory pathway M-ring protein FliF/YscJ